MREAAPGDRAALGARGDDARRGRARRAGRAARPPPGTRAVDAASRTDAYFALRAALCSSRAELALFDDAFDTVFAESDEDRGPLADLAGIPSAILPRTDVPGPDPRSAELELQPVPAAWSEMELLRTKDFALYTDAERAGARALLARLAHAGRSA